MFESQLDLVSNSTDPLLQVTYFHNNSKQIRHNRTNGMKCQINVESDNQGLR